MNPDDFNVSFGALRFPLVPADFTAALGFSPLDPAQTQLLNLFASAINSELGAAWTVVTDRLPVGHYLRGSTPVVDKLEVPLESANMQERAAGWPLLALCRAGEGKYEAISMFQDRLVQTWHLHYILGPLSVGEHRMLSNVLVAAAKIVRMVIRDHGHRSFEAGAVQFGDGKGKLSRIELKSHEGPGQARFVADGPTYLAISMTLETEEITADHTGDLEDYLATDFDIDVINADGNGPDGTPFIVEAQTDEDPFAV